MMFWLWLLIIGLNYSLPVGQSLDATIFRKNVIENKQMTFVAVLPKKGCAPCEKVLGEVGAVQKLVRGILPFLIADEEELIDLLDPESQLPRDKPSVVLFKDGSLNKKKPSDLSAPVLMQFVMDEVKNELMHRMGMPSDDAREEKQNKSKPNSKSKKARPDDDQDVIELTQSTFRKHLMNDPDNVWFVKFYAPWCGHCKALAPTWKDLAKSLKGKVKVAQVDATVHKQLASDFNIQGFPTLLLFPGGKKSESKAMTYPGARDLGALRSFALKHASASVKPVQLLHHDQFEKSCANDLCMISFLPHILDSSAKERKGYLKVLKQVMLQDTAGLPIHYFWTEASHSLDLERALRLEFGWPAVVLISKSKGVYSTYRGGYKKAELVEFIKSVASGRLSGDPLPADLPTWPKTTPWDGKDSHQQADRPDRSDEL